MLNDLVAGSIQCFFGHAVPIGNHPVMIYREEGIGDTFKDGSTPLPAFGQFFAARWIIAPPVAFRPSGWFAAYVCISLYFFSWYAHKPHTKNTTMASKTWIIKVCVWKLVQLGKIYLFVTDILQIAQCSVMDDNDDAVSGICSFHF